MQITLSDQEVARLKNDLIEAKIDCLQSCPSYPIAVVLTDSGGKLRLVIEHTEARGVLPRLVQTKWDDLNKTWSINWDIHPYMCEQVKTQIDQVFFGQE
jgi:pyruvate kinase